ncbi:hypothetical protein PTSG_05008 [Salpingoeca rosetta]|uniref:Sm domain-containing protein n=1 Tax=Salpingoeca rosetta (strain ATCC 50818 / BSB-021) TaxID=946362 RepID=F2U989_SALR5|nr:uncharacterized protein PTSG_05008 [Salpingoeca rosetta]EGD73292.1 hypothetical protein PTSG_05008 [Salpingoeca rosetta]|eukprot:XP_004994323.1 hypothetical protein PTSG_05008 [Salpingoeca rosetta]
MAEEEARSMLKGLLGKLVRVGVSDGRIVQGVFSCVDNGCNIVLTHANEWKGPPITGADAWPKDDELEFRRPIGLVMIPGDHVSRVGVAAQQPQHLLDAQARSNSDEDVSQQLQETLSLQGNAA